jgi:hypothetical protein
MVEEQYKYEVVPHRELHYMDNGAIVCLHPTHYAFVVSVQEGQLLSGGCQLRAIS